MSQASKKSGLKKSFKKLPSKRQGVTTLSFLGFAGQAMSCVVMDAMKSNGYAIALLPMYLQARSDAKEASRKNIEAIHRKLGNKNTMVDFG